MNKYPNEALLKNYNNNNITYQHLSVEERENIAIWLVLYKILTAIANEINRNKSTISRKIRKNNATKHKKDSPAKFIFSRRENYR